MPKRLLPTTRFIVENAESTTDFTPRLYYDRVTEKHPTDYESLAAYIRTLSPKLFFLDSSFFARHQIPADFWAALTSHKVVFTPSVWRELQPVIENPFANRDILEEITRAKSQGSTSILFDDDAPYSSPFNFNLSWYTNLLAVRKRRAMQIVNSFVERQGRDPTTEELNREFQKAGIERDFHLLRKGYTELATGGNFFSDEELVVTAVMGAINDKTDSVILTRDPDLFEQFYKLTGLITKHYQDYWFAKHYAATPESFEKRAMPNEGAHAFELDESFLVKKPVAPEHLVAHILPQEFETLRLACILFGGSPPDLTFTPLLFRGEKGFSDLLVARTISRGLSTSKLNGLNCHVTGLLSADAEIRNWAAIVKDKTLATPDMVFPFLDIEHTILHKEILRRDPSTDPR